MAAGNHSLATVAAVVALAVTLPHGGLGQPAPPTVELREVNSREAPSFTPTLQGQRVTVQGVVSTKAINFGEYAHLPIQNREGTGLAVESGRGTLDTFRPGDIVRAIGVVSHRSGLPVLAVEKISKQGEQDPPVAQNVRVADLTRFETIGKYISVETMAVTIGQNSGGDVLVIGGGNDASILVFYPRYKRWNVPGIGTFHAGDKIRVTGISSQYCPVEPYDRGFQLVIDDPAQIVLLGEHTWTIPPQFMAYFAILLIFALGIWWMREHRMAELRRTTRSMMSLSEEVLSASSVGEIARKVQAVLPGVLNAWSVEVYLFNRMRNTLDRIPDEVSPNEVSIAVDRPNGAFASAVTLCFRNRALLNVPDFRKSPVVDTTHEADLPASAVFVPMFAKGEVLGVVAVNFDVRLQANRNQQAALQHLANQIAASLKLQEQQSIREQLLRTEKMAAAGQLISAVAHDLRAPLSAIRDAANRLSGERGIDGIEIAAEADRGLQIVGHLLSFARVEGSESREVNLHQLISGVMEAREPEWRRKGIPVENALPVSPVEVFADESELEQVMLSLLIHIEHAAQTTQTTQSVRVTSRVLGSRVQISIDFTGASLIAKTADEPTPGDSFSLRVCQAIIQSHGGDIRLLQMPHRRLRYELELPVYNPPLPTDTAEAPSRNASRMLTAILIESDETLKRRLLAMLSARGHRTIPVESPEEAADMVQRMSFDVIFCTSRLPRLSWTEFFKRVRRRIAAFVLLADEQEVDAGNLLKDGSGFLLRKPVEESALDSVLADVELRHGASRQ